MDRHSDRATRFPGEEVDKPGIVLDYCALGKAKEGSTEVHAHRGIAFSVILEGAQEAEDLP